MATKTPKTDKKQLSEFDQNVCDMTRIMIKLNKSIDELVQCLNTLERNGIEKINETIHVRDMFNIIDTNNDKSISVDELAQYLKTLEISMTYKELKEAVNKLDSNKNGRLEFSEFRKFIRQQSQKYSKALDREKQVREAFRMFDRDGNGVIDRMELKKALKTLLGEKQITNEQVSEMMKEADINEDGKIDYEEFMQLWSLKESQD